MIKKRDLRAYEPIAIFEPVCILIWTNKLKKFMRQWENVNMGWIFSDIKDLLFKCDNDSVIFLKESSYIWGTHWHFFMVEMIWQWESLQKNYMDWWGGWSYRLNQVGHELKIIDSGQLIHEGSLCCPLYFCIYLKFSKIKS